MTNLMQSLTRRTSGQRGWCERLEERCHEWLNNRWRKCLEQGWREHPEHMRLGSGDGYVLFHRTKIEPAPYRGSATTSIAIGSHLGGTQRDAPRVEFAVLTVEDLDSNTRLANITYDADGAREMAQLFKAAARRLAGEG